MEDFTYNDIALHEARKRLSEIINATFDNQDTFVELTYESPISPDSSEENINRRRRGLLP